MAESNPVAFNAGQIAGGLGTGGAGVRAAAGAARGGSRVVRGALAGGGQGAVAGFGFAEGNAQERALPAAAGGATGFFLGGALTKVAGSVGNFITARRAGKVVPEADKRAFEVFRDTLATDLRQRGQSRQAARNSAEAELRRFFSKGAKPEDAVNLGGENIRFLVRELASQQPEAALQLHNKVAASQATKLGEAARKLSGGSIKESRKQIQLIKEVQARPAYENAYAVEIPKEVYDASIRDIILRPSVQSAVRKAATKAADEGFADTAQQLRNALRSGSEEIIDTRGLDFVKRALDDRIRTSRTNAPDNARIFTSLKNQIVDAVDDVNPAYREARNLWAGASAAEDSIEAGKDIFKISSTELQDQFTRLTDSEKEFFRLGVADAVRSRINSTRDARNKAAFLTSEEIRGRFRIAFEGKADEIEQFIELVQRSERQLGRLKSVQASSGSQSELRERSAKAFSGEIRRAGNAVADSVRNPIGVPGRIVDAVNNRADQEVSEILADVFFSGPNRLNQAATAIPQGTPQLQLPPPGVGGVVGTIQNQNRE